jgi:hypothetical protein
MMSTESLYIAEQEYSKFQEIMNTKDYISKEEYNFCFAYDKSIKDDTFYIGDYSKLGDYLNLRVYTEYLHHKHVQKMESYC